MRNRKPIIFGGIEISNAVYLTVLKIERRKFPAPDRVLVQTTIMGVKTDPEWLIENDGINCAVRTVFEEQEAKPIGEHKSLIEALEKT